MGGIVGLRDISIELLWVCGEMMNGYVKWFMMDILAFYSIYLEVKKTGKLAKSLDTAIYCILPCLLGHTLSGAYALLADIAR